MFYQLVGGPLDGLGHEESGLADGTKLEFNLSKFKHEYSENFEWPVYIDSKHPLLGVAYYVVDGVVLKFDKVRQ